MGVQVYRRVRVGPQDRSRSQRTDLSLKTRLHGRGLAGVGHDTQDSPRLQDLADAHGNGALRYVFEGREPSFAKLLAPASLVQINDKIGFLGFKIRWRIVECEMPILSDPHERDVDRRREQCLAGVADDFRRILFSIQQIVFRNSSLLNQPFAKKSTEAGRVRSWKANVFVQVKHFDLLPVDSRQTRENLQKLKLRGAGGRDQTCLSLCLYSVPQDRGSLLGRDRGHFELVIEALDHHVETLRNQVFAGSVPPAFSSKVLAIAQHNSTEGNTSSMDERAAFLTVNARMNSAASS